MNKKVTDTELALQTGGPGNHANSTGHSSFAPDFGDCNLKREAVLVAAKSAGVPRLDDLRRLSEQIRRAHYWVNQ